MTTASSQTINMKYAKVIKMEQHSSQVLLVEILTRLKLEPQLAIHDYFDFN